MNWLDFLALWVGYCICALALVKSLCEAAISTVVIFKRTFRFFTDKVIHAAIVAEELEKTK